MSDSEGEMVWRRMSGYYLFFCRVIEVVFGVVNIERVFGFYDVGIFKVVRIIFCFVLVVVDVDIFSIV